MTCPPSAACLTCDHPGPKPCWVEALPPATVVTVEARHSDVQVRSFRRDPRNPEKSEARWSDTVPDLAPTALPDHAIVVDETGVPIMLRTRLPRDVVGPYRRALLAYPCDSGVVRGAGIRNRSRVFGNLSRSGVLRRAACSSCSGAADHPDAHATIVNTAALLAALLDHYLPDVAAAGRTAIEPVLPEWRLPGGLWTSGVLNETSALPYHRDRNNFEAWSAMPTIRRQTRGGHLAFPEIRMADGSTLVLPCGDGDVQFFNGQRWLHGVTPLRKVAPTGYRYSAVYYPVKRMSNCLPFDQELRRAHRTRTANEDTLLARQTAAGSLAAEVESLGIHDDA